MVTDREDMFLPRVGVAHSEVEWMVCLPRVGVRVIVRVRILVCVCVCVCVCVFLDRPSRCSRTVENASNAAVCARPFPVLC